MENRAIVHVVKEDETNTGQLIVACPNTKKCAIIDPVLNFNQPGGIISTESADKLVEFCKKEGYTIQWLLDTHSHADHLTALYYLKKKTGATTAIGCNVDKVQSMYQDKFQFTDEEMKGPFWDQFWKEGDTFKIGDMEVQILYTPGHTPDAVSYYIDSDCVIVGDVIFMPDKGTGRCDFCGGSEEELYESTRKLFQLPKETRVYVCHDSPPEDREYCTETTIASESENNKHVKKEISKEEFVKKRSERDEDLGHVQMLYAAMQFNIRGGMPPPTNRGKDFVLIPLTYKVDW